MMIKCCFICSKAVPSKVYRPLKYSCYVVHCIVVIFLDEHFDLTKATLETISCACVLTNDESVPHKCNQGIVFTSGTHASI